jgi:hypothetical protein
MGEQLPPVTWGSGFTRTPSHRGPTRRNSTRRIYFSSHHDEETAGSKFDEKNYEEESCSPMDSYGYPCVIHVFSHGGVIYFVVETLNYYWNSKVYLGDEYCPSKSYTHIHSLIHI